MKPKPYLFKASGLPNIHLLNGVRIEPKPGYGELVTIDRLPDLIMAKRLRPRPRARPANATRPADASLSSHAATSSKVHRCNTA